MSAVERSHQGQRKETVVDCEMQAITTGGASSGAVPGVGSLQTVGNCDTPHRIAKLVQKANKVSVEIDPVTLCGIFGVSDAQVATGLLASLSNILQPNRSQSVDADLINQVLAMIEGIGPTSMIEAMAATLLVGAHHAAHDSMRRALHPDQTPAGRALYGALALKAMRSFAQLLEVLNQGRGKGFVQKIVVERVTVEPGAQAVVGSVDLTHGRGQAK